MAHIVLLIYDVDGLIIKKNIVEGAFLRVTWHTWNEASAMKFFSINVHGLIEASILPHWNNLVKMKKTSINKSMGAKLRITSCYCIFIEGNILEKVPG